MLARRRAVCLFLSMKLLAIIPFGLFMFFVLATAGTIHQTIWPPSYQDNDSRLASFGLIWILLIALVVSGAAVIAIVKFVPWKLKLK